MNKRVFTMVLSLALIIGIAALLAGCNNGSSSDSGGSDEWSDVDAAKLAGTWARTDTQTKSIEEVYKEAGVTWTDALSLMFGDIEATENSVQTVKTSTSGTTKNITKTEYVTVIYSGGALDPDATSAPAVWALITSALYRDSSKYVAASEGYSVTYTESSGQKALTTTLTTLCQITQDQKKLKTLDGFWGKDVPEMTFTK